MIKKKVDLEYFAYFFFFIVLEKDRYFPIFINLMLCLKNDNLMYKNLISMRVSCHDYDCFILLRSILF